MKQSSLQKSPVVDLAVPRLPHLLDVGRVEGEFTGADLIYYGITVSQFGGADSDEVLEALSWVLLNRRGAGRGVDPLLLPEGASMDWIERAHTISISPHVARAISIFALVVSGAVIDPVRGATRFHGHRETPSWAEKMDLRAVIGPYLFYAGC